MIHWLIQLGMLTPTISMTEATESELSIFSWCEKIHYQSYVLKRMNNTMNMILKRQHEPLIINAIINASTNINPFMCENCCIKTMIKKININKTITPLIKTWHELLLYKHLNNSTDLINNYLILIIHTLNNIITQHYPNKNNLQYLTPTNTLEMLNNIDCLMDDITKKNILPKKNILELQSETSHHHPNYTELFTKTIYYNTRLKRCFNFFKWLKKYFRCAWDFEEIIIKNSIPHLTFSDPTIINCIEKLIDQKNIEPLLELWQEINQGRFIDNNQLLREFAILTYIISNTLIHEYQYCASKKKISKVLPYLYSHFDSLPLEEILEIIDILSEEIPKIISDYDLQKPIGWSLWCRKNCIGFPISLIKLAIKVAIKIKPLFSKRNNNTNTEEKDNVLSNNTDTFSPKN